MQKKDQHLEKITGLKSQSNSCTLTPYGKHGSLGAQWKIKPSHHRIKLVT